MKMVQIEKSCLLSAVCCLLSAVCCLLSGKKFRESDKYSSLVNYLNFITLQNPFQRTTNPNTLPRSTKIQRELFWIGLHFKIENR